MIAESEGVGKSLPGLHRFWPLAFGANRMEINLEIDLEIDLGHSLPLNYLLDKKKKNAIVLIPSSLSPKMKL